ncbi:MAG: hypothetical protein ACK5TN_11100 [Acidobacteriota bacterium]|jgi:hypothetical protein
MVVLGLPASPVDPDGIELVFLVDFLQLRDHAVLTIRTPEAGLAAIARVVALQAGPGGMVFERKAIPCAGEMKEAPGTNLSCYLGPESKRILDKTAGGAPDERGVTLPSGISLENKLHKIDVDLMETMVNMAKADFAAELMVDGFGVKVEMNAGKAVTPGPARGT